MTHWKKRHAAAMMGTTPVPLAILARGDGCAVWDTDGKRYLDFLAGIAVNSLGHNHPVLVDAVSRQVASLAHVSNYFATPQQIELAERLRRISGAGDRGRVFFCNSGAEAIEAALKLARLNPGRGRILALNFSFHGRTMGSLVAHRKTRPAGGFRTADPRHRAHRLDDRSARGGDRRLRRRPVRRTDQGRGGGGRPAGGIPHAARGS